MLGDSANDTVGLDEEKANSIIPRSIENESAESRLPGLIVAVDAKHAPLSG
jgi:hypothetical protein